MRDRVIRLLAIVGLGVAAGCGGSDCLALPCPFPLGLTVNVSSTLGPTVGNATVQYTAGNNITNTVPCAGTCMIGGFLGKYDLIVSAPGYTSQSTSVTVTGHDGGKCGCMSLDPQTVNIKLPPA